MSIQETREKTINLWTDKLFKQFWPFVEDGGIDDEGYRLAIEASVATGFEAAMKMLENSNHEASMYNEILRLQKKLAKAKEQRNYYMDLDCRSSIETEEKDAELESIK